MTLCVICNLILPKVPSACAVRVTKQCISLAHNMYVTLLEISSYKKLLLDL